MRRGKTRSARYVDGFSAMFRNVIYVMLGGAFGSLARYAVGLVALNLFQGSFPLGTLFVNVVGSFLLGIIASVPESGDSLLSAQVRLLLGTGVMGGFTTYSAFNLEVLRMTQKNSSVEAMTYAFFTLTVCLAAGWIGIRAGSAA